MFISSNLSQARRLIRIQDTAKVTIRPLPGKTLLEVCLSTLKFNLNKVSMVAYIYTREGGLFRDLF